MAIILYESPHTGSWVSIDTDIDVASCGECPHEALEMLLEAVDLYYDNTEEERNETTVSNDSPDLPARGSGH